MISHFANCELDKLFNTCYICINSTGHASHCEQRTRVGLILRGRVDETRQAHNLEDVGAPAHLRYNTLKREAPESMCAWLVKPNARVSETIDRIGGQRYL